MQEIPSFWRTEVWHALSIHFPIVLLSLASVAYPVQFFLKDSSWTQFISKFVFLTLILGVAGAWISVLLGDRAYNVVVRTLCDPEVLQDHQWWAYFATITYSVALLLFGFLQFKHLTKDKLWMFSLCFILLVGVGGLGYSGHLGASVVYQQSGGTYVPSENCVEFE